MTILAIDPSLRSTGFAYRQDEQLYTGTIPVKNLRGCSRLRYIQEKFQYLLDTVEPKVVAYENYSMGSHGRVFDIGELGGVLKLEVFTRGIGLLLVPPKTLKQFATGSGNADKPAMKQGLYCNFGYELGQDDEIDALLLLIFAEQYLSDVSRFRYAEKCEFVVGARCN